MRHYPSIRRHLKAVITTTELSDPAADSALNSGPGCGEFTAEDAKRLPSGGCALQNFANEYNPASYPGFSVNVAGGESGLAAGSR